MKKPSSSSSSRTLRFEDGAVQFRQRLVVSLLSHRPLLILNIRADDISNPGLHDHEASFLRLLDSMTNGTRIEINSTGTQLRFVPGVLLGGDIKHECPDSRSIGWFLEGILPLLPWGKEDARITFTGITDGLAEYDAPSVDYWIRATKPLFEKLGISTGGGVGLGSIMSNVVTAGDGEDGGGPVDINANDGTVSGPKIRIVRRAAGPDSGHGSGCVVVTFPMVRELQSMDWVDPGKIKRIRGTATSCKIVSSSMAARVAYSAKGIFHKLLPDVWIHTDVHTMKNHGCGPSPGLQLVVSSESTTGVILTAEACMDNSKNNSGSNRGTELPEDLGKRGACLLLEEIRRGGCIDTSCQSLAFLLMSLGPEDVSRIRVGTLSQYSIETLRLIKHAFDVEFKVTPDTETQTVLLSVLGSGYRNMARAST